MNIKIGYRVLAILLVLCMVGNGPAVYAANSADHGMQETTAEESTEGSADESVEESADCTKTSETDCTEENSTVVEEDSTSSETIEIVESSEEIETVIEEDVSESTGAYKISGNVTDITSKSAKFSFNLEGGEEGETVYIKVYYFSEGEVKQISQGNTVKCKQSGIITISNLYADMDYTIWAVMYTDSLWTAEELYRTEEMYFHTLPNEVDYKSDVTFTNITDRSVTVSITPSDEMVSAYQSLDVNSFYVGIEYKVAGSTDEYPVSNWMLMSEANGYFTSLELTNLCAETGYDIKITWPILGNSGKELSEYRVTTSELRIKYNFSVEGDTIASGKVCFSIQSGYVENEEFSLIIYMSNSREKEQVFDSVILNAENDYTYESTKALIEQWDEQYTVWAEVIQQTDSGTLNILMTDRISKKVERVKVFDLTLVENSVTYITAKINVEWINTDAIPRDEVEIRLITDDWKIQTQSITFTKDNKEKELIEFFELHPGKEYKFTVIAYIDDVCYYFDTISFVTKEYSFETFTEVKTPSKLDIAKKWQELGIDLDYADDYQREVNHIDGGLLSENTLQNATDLVNFIRYVAGLPADLIYDEEWSSICNAGCEIDRLINTLTHTPSKPEGITESFYQRGYRGTINSNMARGPVNSARTILGYMSDPGENNISKGHRTWILEPALSTLGFGKSGAYYAMYVFSAFGVRTAREVSFDKGYYHWPAANMPMEIYTIYDTDYTPSLHLSTEYDSMQADDITVKVVSKKLGKSWVLTGDSGTYSSKLYMRVYGRKLVFSTGIYPKGDEVTVTVTGTTINGVDAPITYTMNFFSIEDIEVPDILAESISILSEDTEVMENESIQLEAQILPENATNKNIFWSVESADGKGQADITEDGVLTGNMPGVVKVTAACESDPSILTCVYINVTEWKIPIESIVLSKSSLRLEKGDTGYISATLLPANTTENEVVYTSSSPEKVSVENGYVHAWDITQEPVTITVSVGSISSVCMVEVYENTEEEMDKNYDTRITDIVMSGENNVCIGESGIIKLYPVTNGQHIGASEYEITVKCNEKYLSMEPVTSEDYGCWYQLIGTKKGKQKLTVKMTSKVEGNKNPETVTKNFTFTVKQKTEEEAAEIITAPVLAKNNITINQNTVTGTALDIRLIEGNETVVKAYLTSRADDGTENLFSITRNMEEGLFYIQTKEIGANKKYKLILHIDTEQGNWVYPITVTTKKSFPSVSIKQTVKPNVQMLNEDAVLKITGREQIENVVFKTESFDFYQKSEEGTGTEHYLTIGQSEHGKKLNKKGIVEISFEGYRAVYSKKVTLATVSKKIKSHTLVSDVKKVTLNSVECGEVPATVKMSLKNSTEKYPVKIFTNGTNSKAKQMLQAGNIYFTYNKNTGALNVFAKNAATKGTYKYKLTGYALENGNVVNTAGAITLSVVVATVKPTLKLKASGSIDLIARGHSCVTYTPTVKNYAGRVASVELEGDDVAKFYARVDANGKIKVYVREKAMVYPKTTYNLGIKATLTNGYVCDVVGVKIKPKQSSFKVVAKQSTITLCRNEVNGQPLGISVKSPAASQIAYIKAVSVPEGISYSSYNKTIKITDSNKVKAGKTYKITFEVTPKGAYRSIKPAKVTIKIKVK